MESFTVNKTRNNKILLPTITAAFMLGLTGCTNVTPITPITPIDSIVPEDSTESDTLNNIDSVDVVTNNNTSRSVVYQSNSYGISPIEIYQLMSDRDCSNILDTIAKDYNDYLDVSKDEKVLDEWLSNIKISDGLKEIIDKAAAMEYWEVHGDYPAIDKMADTEKDEYENYVKEQTKTVIINNFRNSKELIERIKFHIDKSVLVHDILEHDMDAIVNNYYDMLREKDGDSKYAISENEARDKINKPISKDNDSKDIYAMISEKINKIDIEKDAIMYKNATLREIIEIATSRCIDEIFYEDTTK